MIARVLNSDANKHKMAGARIHDYTHPAWKLDIDILVGGAGNVLSYITIPKCTSLNQAREMITYIQKAATFIGITREIPVHILIETHGALNQVHDIAKLPWVQVLDFGLMDFVSAHHGAIPASAMRSPGQFEHRLLARAKAEVVSAALANGVVPAHNVTLDLKNVETTMSDASRARNEIVDAMKPNFDEVSDAANILLAAQQADWGPIQYAGELHDRATYRYFWEVLQKAKLTNVPISDESNKAFFS
jgi:citrate lyase subunit beta/citryl-CoA lyase